MGKAARRKKIIHEGQAGEIVKSSKDSVTPQIKKGIQEPTSGTKVLLLIFLILLFSFTVYFNSLPNDFVYDDRFQVKENHWITDVKYIPEILSTNVWSFRKNFGTTNYYRPMMHLIYMLNFHIFGLKPWGFHLVNILLHAGVSALVFMIAWRLLAMSAPVSATSLAPPFMAALLFASHPIHTEAVTWIAGVPDLSSTFFLFLSFYFYVRSLGNKLQSKTAYAISVASFFVATLCKETALTLPIILAAYDYTFRRDAVRFISSLKRYVPYLAVVGVYFVLRFHALGKFVPQRTHAELSTYQYIINIFPLFMQYLEKLILPVNLNNYYVLHPVASLLETRELLSIVVTISFFALSLIAFRKNKLIFLSFVFIVVPLLPTLYIPALAENTFAERYLYIPSFGFVLLLASLLQWARFKKAASVTFLAIIFVIVAGFYSWGTVSRNTVWKDNYTLFSDTVKKSPDAKAPHYDLADAFSEKGRIDDAIEQLQIALSLDPDYIDARNNLGIAFYKKGWTDRAVEQYQYALRLDPDYARAHSNLGVVFFSRGLVDKAIEHYQYALRLNPDDGDTYYNLGLAFSKKGWMDKAIEQYLIALKLTPNAAAVHCYLGLAFLNRGWTDKAIEQLQIALKLDANLPMAHIGLGMVLFNKGLNDKAAKEFQIASTLDPGLADAHNDLGVVYKKLGAIDKAVNEYQTAIKLDPSNQAYRDNLARAYEARRGSR